MTQFRISEAAGLLGVSDDTVRRWVDAGSLTAARDAAGRSVVDGAELARMSAVLADKVMAQVEIQCGPHRVVSLMSSEAVRELGLEVGSLAVAVVKATTVIVETPKGRS